MLFSTEVWKEIRCIMVWNTQGLIQHVTNGGHQHPTGSHFECQASRRSLDGECYSCVFSFLSALWVYKELHIPVFHKRWHFAHLWFISSRGEGYGTSEYASHKEEHIYMAPFWWIKHNTRTKTWGSFNKRVNMVNILACKFITKNNIRHNYSLPFP